MDGPELQSVDLVEGEKVLWSAKPVVAMAGTNPIFPKAFGLFFAAFAVFWMFGAAGGFSSGTGSAHHSAVFPFFGLPFLVVGLYIAFGPNFAAAQRLKNTLYVLTDRRALIVTEGRVRSLKAYDLSSMNAGEKQVRPDGIGSVSFQLKDAGALMSMVSYRNANQFYMAPPGFYGIKDVDSVYRLIESARTSVG